MQEEENLLKELLFNDTDPPQTTVSGSDEQGSELHSEQNVSESPVENQPVAKEEVALPEKSRIEFFPLLRLIEPFLLGVFLYVIRYYWDLNYGLLVSLIAVGILLRLKFFREPKKLLDGMLYIFILYMAMLMLFLLFQKIATFWTTVFYLLPEFSLIIGLFLVWDTPLKCRIQPKFFLVKDRGGTLKLLMFSLIAGIISGYILSAKDFGLIIIPTLIWLGALLGKFMFNSYWNWIGTTSFFSLGVVFSVFIGRFNAIQFIKYSPYEFWLAYNSLLLLFMAELLLVILSEHFSVSGRE